MPTSFVTINSELDLRRTPPQQSNSKPLRGKRRKNLRGTPPLAEPTKTMGSRGGGRGGREGEEEEEEEEEEEKRVKPFTFLEFLLEIYDHCTHSNSKTTVINFATHYYPVHQFNNTTNKTHYLSFIHSFIHSVFCLTTGPKPKRALHIVRSRTSSFK
jgi:hypothetical protein